jgi:DNA topoisomerase VI subunit B
MTTKAHEMAKNQRDISVAEFFEKNRHLLGFDNPTKALLTTIKEAVDNALDACEEAEILPEIEVQIIKMNDEVFRIIVGDNGPGIIKSQIPPIFGKLLYGSKFHQLKQQRGQQGIGISAAALYAQLTTGKGIRIISRIHEKEPAHFYLIKIDTRKNKPEIIEEGITEWDNPHGTVIEVDIKAEYKKGDISVDEYLKQTAIVNPHVTIIYTNPELQQEVYVRATDTKPKLPNGIKPHPYGVELGRLMGMLKWTASKTINSFLMDEFSRVGATTAKRILETAAILPRTKPKTLTREQAEALIRAINTTQIISPPTECISPIGEDLILAGLRKEVEADFFTAVTRPPTVYRGNPFVIECGLAYGGKLDAEGPIKIMRFANRVPLLYQRGACAVTESTMKTNWKAYHLKQPRGSRPIGPAVLVVHMASVWVPFTSEAKEAIAHYPEIVKEIKLALQEAGRKLGIYLSRKAKAKKELKKFEYLKRYVPHVAEALKELNELSLQEQEQIEELLLEVLEDGRRFTEDNGGFQTHLQLHTAEEETPYEHADQGPE